MPDTFPHGEDDHAHTNVKKSENSKLWKVSNDDSAHIQKVEIGEVLKANLEHDDVYILDCTDIGILYIWMGASASVDEQIHAMDVYAKEFVESCDQGPHSCSVVAFCQGQEPSEFTQYFPDW